MAVYLGNVAGFAAGQVQPMIQTPQVSVVMPIYNAAQYLRSSLACVCAQTLRNIELICVNDGSTDESPALLQELAAGDSRVCVIHQENQGAGPARNAGLAAARGEYVIFLDADDIYLPQMLEHMVDRAEQTHADVVLCRARFVTADGRMRSMPVQLRAEYLRKCGTEVFCPRQEIPECLFQFCAGWPWDKLYRREYILKTGLQYQALRHTNDAYFVYMSLVKAAVVSVVPSVLVHHCQHAESTSHSTGQDTTCLTEALLAIHREIQPLGNPKLEKSFNHWAMNMAVWHYRQVAGEATAALQTEYRTRLEPALQLLSKGAAYYPRKRDWLRYKECVAPEISVVLPIYNASAYLPAALDSLLAQSFSDWEAICVNDGSTDDSLEILKRYAARDRRIRILDGPNGGYGRAMNRGMAAAGGKYLAILEPDDELPRNAYRHLYALAEKHGADIAKGCVSRFVQQGSRRNYVETTRIPRALCAHPICPRKQPQAFTLCMNTWTCLYRRSFLEQHGIRHHETPGAAYQDNGLFFLSFAHAQKLICTNEVVYFCRRDNAGSSVHAIGKRPYAMRDEYAYIRRELEKTPELWQQLRPVWLRKRLDNHFFTYTHLPAEDKAAYLADLKSELAEMQNKTDRDFLSAGAQKFMDVLESKDVLSAIEATDAMLPSGPPQKTHRSLFCTRTPYKTTWHLCGIPLWSRGTKAGRTTWRVLGIPVKRKKSQ